MSLDTSQPSAEPGASTAGRAAPHGVPAIWGLALAVLASGLLALAVLFSSTIESAVRLWSDNASYNHGFLILPISLYLAWTRREDLLKLRPWPSLLGLLGVWGAAAIWFLADLASINELRQFALVGMLVSFVVTCLGLRALWLLIFPLVYLFLMVPSGEFLLPVLQQVARELSVAFLALGWLPFYSEGLTIEMPRGRFFIAPGCAGFNFITASMALAPLYAYIVYRRLWKCLLAVLVMLVAAILANGLRIFLIILAAHYFDQELSIVDDHLFYGWAFFGVIMLLLGWWGLRFSDRPSRAELQFFAERPQLAEPTITSIAQVLTYLLLPVLALSGALAVYLWSASLQPDLTTAQRQVEAPAAVGPWRSLGLGGEVYPWLPRHAAADLRVLGAYKKRGAGPALIFLSALYETQGDGKELLSHSNNLGSYEGLEVLKRTRKTLASQAGDVPLIESVMSFGSRRFIAWQWTLSGGELTTSRLDIKLNPIKALLLGAPSQAGTGLILLPVQGDLEKSRAELESFFSQVPRAWILMNEAGT